MKLSKQSRREGKELFRSCLVNGLLDEGRARQAVQKTLELKPRGYLAVLSHFERLVRLELARRTARIESAVPLAQDLRTTLEAALARAYGSGLNVNYAENRSLIGGMRIQVGSDVYDGSVQARLAALEAGF